LLIKFIAGVNTEEKINKVLIKSDDDTLLNSDTLCEIYKKKINFLPQMIESRLRKPDL